MLIESPAIPGSSLLGEDVLYSDYIIHQVDLQDEETGEAFSAARTMLLGPGHEPIEFVSAGVLQSIRRIAAVLKKLPPYDPPLLVKITQVRTRGGRRTFKLVVQPDE